MKTEKGRKIRNIVIFAVTIIAISLAVLGVLWGTGVFYFDDGFHFNMELFDGIKGEWYFFLVYWAIQIILTTLLCFVPGTSAVMIGVAVAIWGAGWKSFVMSAAGVYFSSFAMYAVGRIGGHRAIERLIGKEDTEKATRLLREHGNVYFPVMLMCAGFPDDALVMVAGAVRMNFLYFLVSVLIGRGIGIATICFGVKILPEIDSLWAFIEVATVCVFWLLVVFYIAHRLNVWLEKRRRKDKEKKEDSENDLSREVSQDE